MSSVGRLLAVLALGSAVGCTTVVTPPGRPADPVPVFVVDHGRHAGLALPGADGSLVEYTYGEWQWFALMSDGWYRVPIVLYWPTAGALGRREIPGTAGVAALREQNARGAAMLLGAQLGAQIVHPVPVERTAALALRARLDADFAAGRAELHSNPIYGLDFVPDARSFWVFHNCNTVVAEWLAAMGCDVGSVAPVADYEVRLPAGG